MTTIKVQHADPASSNPVAFDILNDGDKETIADTFVLESGHFKLLELTGGLHLREVSPAEIKARADRIAEQREIEAEVAREQRAKADAEIASKAQAERDERKARIEAGVAAQLGTKPATEDKPAIDAATDKPAPPNSEENPPPRPHDDEVHDSAMDIGEMNSAGVAPQPEPFAPRP